MIEKVTERDTKEITDNMIRNVQLILTYCMIEIIRQNLVECAPRAKLLNMIWNTVIEIQLMQNLKLCECKDAFNEF